MSFRRVFDNGVSESTGRADGRYIRGSEERRHEGNIENGVESMVTDNGGDAGTGLQECRGPLIGTRIWNTSGKQ